LWGWEIALDGSLKACIESWLKLLDSTSPPGQAEEGWVGPLEVGKISVPECKKNKI
jgi:hypothetical protein